MRILKNKLIFTLLLGIVLPAYSAEYASLKYNEVNLRTGPGEKFPVQWVYQEKGYPVEVLDSFELWRQVREKDGTIGWIHQNMLMKSRSVLITKESPLLRNPESTAQTVAILQPGVIAKVDRCEDGPYCRLVVNYQDKKYSGWFLRSNVWGVGTYEIIEH